MIAMGSPDGPTSRQHQLGLAAGWLICDVGQNQVARHGSHRSLFAMATIVREIQIAASAESVWDAVRDVGAVHRRLAPGLVVDVILESGLRHVTFANGLVLDEMIVSVDESIRRVAYTALNRAKHHQASMQVFSKDKDCCRFVWITDVLPDEISERFAAVMDQAIPVIERTLVTHTTEPNQTPAPTPPGDRGSP